MTLTKLLQTIVCLTLLVSLESVTPLVAAQSRNAIWVDLNTPTQTVEVHTPRSDYFGVVRHETVIQPNGTARGALWLSTRGGTLVKYDSFYGQVVYQSTDSGVTWQQIILYLRAPDGRWLVVVVRPAVQEEECVVYDLVGPGVQASWEAQSQITLSQR